MTVYKVTMNVRDTQDEALHLYRAGEIFPREGFEVSEERIKTLLKEGILEKVEEEVEKPKKKSKTKE